eukprot:c18407_g1_i2 orf=3-383(-)
MIHKSQPSFTIDARILNKPAISPTRFCSRTQSSQRSCRVVERGRRLRPHSKHVVLQLNLKSQERGGILVAKEDKESVLRKGRAGGSGDDDTVKMEDNNKVFCTPPRSSSTASSLFFSRILTQLWGVL